MRPFSRVAIVVGAALAPSLHSGFADALPGAAVPRDPTTFASDASEAPDDSAPLTADGLWYAVGVELAKRGVQLAEIGLRMAFTRDRDGEWFVRVSNRRTGCEASKAIGSFETLIPERAQSVAGSVLALIESSRCAGSPPAPRLPSPPATAAWVRPAGGVFAAGSGLLLFGVSQSDPPNFSTNFAHAPSAYFSSGLALGFVGGTATMLVPETAARPTLELAFFSSGALLATAFSHTFERGVPSYGMIAMAGGYGVSALLVGLDWSFSDPASMLNANRHATVDDVPRRALSPWLRYSPAVAGSLVSMAPALNPEMGSADRELVVGFGAAAFAPALAVLVLGVLDGERAAEDESSDFAFGPGPLGSVGLTLGGEL